MKFRNETRRRIRLWLFIIGAGILIGPPINYITVSPTMGSLLRGVMDGAIIAGLVGGYTQFVRDQLFRRYFRSLNFTVSLLVNTFIYFLLFHIGRLFSVMSRSPGEVTGGPVDFLLDTQVLTVIPVFFACAVLIEFILQMNRLIGHNVLWYFIAGTYHRPKEEERIFLFLDLRDSTKMAEQMGGKSYYEMLDLFVHALTEPVLETRGEIHEYVGDEVVITWKFDAGLRNGNCLRCFFLIEDTIAEMADEFERRFARQPHFRAGLHGGTVIAGELGDIKRDIVFVGDIMNTAARIEEYAKKEGRSFVVSDAIIENIDMPPDLVADYAGDHLPRGKETSVKLYEVRRDDRDAAS